ncbi:MAG TPA: glycine/sarcosine/betaine reductase complex component C subunit beta [Candidatus Eisenbacteria bacterium]|nr:glycine/sarcosine/betaine reductase complex component C subunit beta [Candidatus Eisenbacteria bacterium]
MSELTTAVRVGIEGVFYSLAHVPDLVRYGSKPLREIRANPALGNELKQKLRDFGAAVAYPPHQAYIGNIAPERLSDLPKPWYEKLIEGATSEGRFGDVVEQNRFYILLAAADQFDLVSLENGWFRDQDGQPSVGAPKLRSTTEIHALCEKGALPLYSGERLIGAFEAAHAEDASLAADVLLENLAAKVTAAHSLRSVCKRLDLDPTDIDFVISCSEEAVGDRYNRGGGNLAKAIAEQVGCVRASGCDVKAFCAGPMYAMVQGASLVQSGVAKKVAVVAGGSLAKLGMKFESHLKKNMPALEDVLGSFAVILSAAKPGEPCMRLDSAAFHPVGAGASPQAMAENLAEKPLAKLGMKLTDVDRYGVELHNPEITVPSGSGDVPRTNYLTLAALAVMRGQISKANMEDFVRTRGMLGYAPTQGHIPSAIVYLGHAVERLRAKQIRHALLIAKGSLFLGRMTQLSDGCSFLVDRNDL